MPFVLSDGRIAFQPGARAVTSTISRRAAWIAYDVLAELVVWVLLIPVAGLRLVLGRVRIREISEWLGAAAVPPRRAPRRVVVHAVSAGEAAAAGAFIVAMRRARPDWSIVLTCGNRAGRSMADDLQRRIPTIESVRFLPWDRRPAVERFVRDVDADAVVVVEPEIWPNLYRACERASVPVMLVNAHIYPRDVPRYRLVRWFLSDVLRVPAWIAVQSARDRDALIAIGAPAEKLVLSGSLKFDAAGQSAAAVGSRLDGRVPVVVGGSTHHPEEEWLLDACERLRRSFAGLRLVVAPRDVRRVPRVVRLARARGLRTVVASAVEEYSSPWCKSIVAPRAAMRPAGQARRPSISEICEGGATQPDGMQRRSNADGVAPRAASSWDVMIVDRFGVLPAMYAAADVAFVGGTLARRGGHNVLEPAAHGRPVIVGPHVDHVRDIVDGLEAAGGLIRLDEATPSALADAIGRLLGDGEARLAIGDRARAYQRGHAGAAERCARAVIDTIESDADDFRKRSSD